MNHDPITNLHIAQQRHAADLRTAEVRRLGRSDRAERRALDRRPRRSRPYAWFAGRARSTLTVDGEPIIGLRHTQ